MSKDGFKDLSRRDVLRTGVAASALGVIAAPALVRTANAQSKFDWKRYAGEKLDVMMVKNPRSDLLQGAEKEFFDLTGITVSSEQIPEQQQRQNGQRGTRLDRAHDERQQHVAPGRLQPQHSTANTATCNNDVCIWCIHC